MREKYQVKNDIYQSKEEWQAKFPITCCFTGRRDIPEKQTERILQELRQKVELAISDGFRIFLSGFARGADMMAAKVVAEQKEKRGDIALFAFLPYEQRLIHPELQGILKKCDKILVVAKKYDRWCFYERNRLLVEYVCCKGNCSDRWQSYRRDGVYIGICPKKTKRNTRNFDRKE